MKFLFLGAGAIGTYVGGSLAAGGHRVCFTERPDVAAQLSERGLVLHIGGEVSLGNPMMLDWVSALHIELPSHAIRSEVSDGESLLRKVEMGLLDAALCLLIYKPLSPILHGRK